MRGFAPGHEPIVSEECLANHYRRTGAKYPGEQVCSRVRWRIFLRKKTNSRRYDYAVGYSGTGNLHNGRPMISGF